MATKKSLEVRNSIGVTSTDPLDGKYEVQDNVERDSLITNKSIRLGHIIYNISDNERYKLHVYPSEGSLVGVIWDRQLKSNEAGGGFTNITWNELIAKVNINQTKVGDKYNVTTPDTNNNNIIYGEITLTGVNLFQWVDINQLIQLIEIV